MKILYSFLFILITFAGFYSAYGVFHFKWMYHSLENPRADFQIYENENDGVEDKVVLVEFLNYGCGYCKQMHPTLNELLALRKDITYIVRPVVFGNERMVALSNQVIAAGLQGKFWEMHNAVLEYPEQDVPDSFIEETASLYGIDYQKLVADSQGDEVRKIAENNFKAFSHASISSVPSFILDKEILIVKDENLPTLQDMIEWVTTAKNK